MKDAFGKVGVVQLGLAIVILMTLSGVVYNLLPKLSAETASEQTTPLASSLSTVPAEQPERILTVGSISPDVKEEIDDFLGFTEFLADRLAGAGITGGKVIVVPTMSDMAAQLAGAQVDLYIDSPFPALKVAEQAGAQPLVRRWKKGVGAYHSVIFTRGDNGARSLDDLKGELIAFDEPSSTSGYLLPKANLLAAGYKLQEVQDLSGSVPADTIGYIFSKDDVNTMLWVLEGRVAAGVIDNLNYEEEAGARFDELFLLERTPEVPRHMVVHRGDLEPELVAALSEALLSMHEDEAGKTVLEEFQRTVKFDPLPDEGLNTVRQLMARVQDEVE